MSVNRRYAEKKERTPAADYHKSALISPHFHPHLRTPHAPKTRPFSTPHENRILVLPLIVFTFRNLYPCSDGTPCHWVSHSAIVCLKSHCQNSCEKWPWWRFIFSACAVTRIPKTWKWATPSRVKRRLREKVSTCRRLLWSVGTATALRVRGLRCSIPSYPSSHSQILHQISFQVVLLNGSWDTSTRIPSIVAEMHNVNVDELRVFQRRQQVQQQQQIQQQLPQEVVKREVVSSPAISDCAQEIDCTDSNLSWLLNYKIQELPPVPGKYWNESFRTNIRVSRARTVLAGLFTQRHLFFNNCLEIWSFIFSKQQGWLIFGCWYRVMF